MRLLSGMMIGLKLVSKVLTELVLKKKETMSKAVTTTIANVLDRGFQPALISLGVMLAMLAYNFWSRECIDNDEEVKERQTAYAIPLVVLVYAGVFCPQVLSLAFWQRNWIPSVAAVSAVGLGVFILNLVFD